MSAPPGTQPANHTSRRHHSPPRVLPIALGLALLWGCTKDGPPQGPPGGGPGAESKQGGGGEGPGAAAGPPGAPGAAKPQVTVVTLEPRDVQLTRELPGRVSPFLVSEVRPQASGIVEKRLFTEGSKVKENQPLYQLEDDTLRANVKSAEATVARARAALKVSRENARRSQMLIDGEAISAQQYDNAVAQAELAQADLRSAQAALESARVLLGYALITAPIAGRIGKSSVTEGALVTTAQPNALATVQQLDPVYVDVTQSASELLELRRAIAEGHLGQDEEAPVAILLEDGTRYAHPGTLRFADVTVDPTTGSFLIRIEVANPEDLLLPGMYVRAVLGAGVRKNGLLVPQQGVTRDPTGQATALVVGQDGKVAQRALKAAQTVGSDWLVESGLTAGDRVIVQGLQKVRPGLPVEAVEAQDPEGATGGSGSADGGVALPPGK